MVQSQIESLTGAQPQPSAESEAKNTSIYQSFMNVIQKIEGLDPELYQVSTGNFGKVHS